MLNQTGIKKESGISKKIILIAPELAFALPCKVTAAGVEAGDDGRKIIKAGTPLYGNLTARNSAFTASSEGASGSEAKATAYVSGTGITKAEVDADTFGTAVSNIGDRYVFTASVADTVVTWTLEGETVTLSTYGIEVTGTAADGDKITVLFTPAMTGTPVGIARHDVDVTGLTGSETVNATCLIFGFVDLSKLEADVVEILTEDMRASLPKITFIK